LHKLDHPNIVNYHETYDDSKQLYLVMEFVEGRELLEIFTEDSRGKLGEKEVAGYMEQLLKALNHCHANGVVHRDVKPANIMITNSGSLRLLDFGLSKIQESKSLKTRAGTPLFMAPEVLAGKYGAEADIWSVGVMLYVLVSGHYPFEATRAAELWPLIKEGRWSFNQSAFDKVSPMCKDLIEKLLVVDVKKRLTGQRALEHPWF